MKKILIFSDSHGDNEKISEISEMEKPDLVLHAGDYCCSNNEISKFINYFCCGNNDYCSKDQTNGQKIVKFKYENLSFLLTHSDNFSDFKYNVKHVEERMAKLFSRENIDVIIFGHSHEETVDKIYNILFINPGSITYPRGNSEGRSYAILKIENGKIYSKEKKEIIRYI